MNKRLGPNNITTKEFKELGRNSRFSRRVVAAAAGLALLAAGSYFIEDSVGKPAQQEQHLLTPKQIELAGYVKGGATVNPYDPNQVVQVSSTADINQPSAVFYSGNSGKSYVKLADLTGYGGEASFNDETNIKGTYFEAGSTNSEGVTTVGMWEVERDGSVKQIGSASGNVSSLSQTDINLSWSSFDEHLVFTYGQLKGGGPVAPVNIQVIGEPKL
jgi:hypothetical protein